MTMKAEKFKYDDPVTCTSCDKIVAESGELFGIDVVLDNFDRNISDAIAIIGICDEHNVTNKQKFEKAGYEWHQVGNVITLFK